MNKTCNVLPGATSYNHGQYIFEKVFKELGNHYEVSGHLVKGSEETVLKKVSKILQGGEDILSLNLACGEAIHIDGSSVYTGYGRQVIPYITEHPLELDKKLRLLDKETVVYACDRYFAEYIERHYGMKAILVPVCGVQGDKIIPWNKRGVDVFFAGSYLDESAIIEKLEKVIPTRLERVYKDIIKFYEKEHLISLEDALCRGLDGLGVPYTDTTVREFLTEYGGQLLDYMKRKHKNMAIQRLLEMGIKVTVTGINWEIFRERLSGAAKENLIILSRNMNFTSVVEFMGKSKIVLNFSEELRNGIHNRVATAMLNGAVCFTEENVYTKEVLNNHENIELYRYDKLDTMVKRVKEILANEELGNTISKNAMAFAQEEYTPEKFAERIVNSL